MVEKRQTNKAGPFAVTGITDSGLGQRLEIRDLQANPQLWNLFIQAMERFQAAKEGGEESYYQISGIHGAPFVAWDGVSRSGNGGGYCTHASNLFGPWHRPYLALFEQSLHKHALAVANQYPAGQQRNAQLQLAAQLRMPYWDWAERRSGPILPSAVTTPQIQVTRPNGASATIGNPLFQFSFHPLKPSDFQNQAPFSVWTSTKRAATSQDRNAQSQNNQVEASLQAGMGSFRNRLYNLFTRQTTFNLFSNKGSGQTTGDNLESIHDFIHSTFGGNSHMNFPQYAAFDPIFFLHHANIDRLLAMWQALYPNTYVDPASQPGGTYTIQSGSSQNANSPLTPFHSNTGGSFHTANSVRTTTAFGYTYPELADNPSRSTLVQRINSLYAPPASGVSSNMQQTKRGLNLESTHGLNLNYNSSSPLNEYACEITMPVNPFGSTYSVAVFLGDFDPNPFSWPTEPNYVGSHASLPVYGGLNIKNVCTATIPLTDALLRKYQDGELDSLDKNTIEAYLRKNLHWRVQAACNPLKRLQVAGLRVNALSTPVHPRTSDSTFPTYQKTSTVAGVIDYDEADPPYMC
jgi:tyrosinase